MARISEKSGGCVPKASESFNLAKRGLNQQNNTQLPSSFRDKLCIVEGILQARSEELAARLPAVWTAGHVYNEISGK